MTAFNERRASLRPERTDPIRVFAHAHAPTHGLARAVEAAVRQIDESKLNPVSHPRAGEVLESRALLGLLAFWYARQVYSSLEIAAKLREDFSLHNLPHDALPDARLLRRFRANNREALDLCLRQVLRFMAEEKVFEGIVTHVSETHFQQEATRRIVMGMFTDSLELDKNSVTQEPAELGFIVANE